MDSDVLISNLDINVVVKEYEIVFELLEIVKKFDNSKVEQQKVQ
jgi:hypothetical protein